MVKILLLTLGLGIAANESGKVYAHKVFSQVGTNGAVHVLIHSDGHLATRPFVIHVRAECEKTGSNWRKLDIKLAESACFVDKNAIELNRMTQEIFIKTYEIDQEDYQKQLMKTPATARAQCLKEPTIARFDVKNLCDDTEL